jgi:glycosyltransferase involved in cell wall biosynthesis
MADCIVFWQRMLSPHMTELARQLVLTGAEVHYVTEEDLSTERRAMGWEAGELSGVAVHRITTSQDVCSLVDHLPANAVHITQGVRSNGLIAHAQKRISQRGLRQYPIMEKVDLRGLGGWIKPLLYRLRFWILAWKIEGLLAIGESTPEWVASISPTRLRAIPFAYFLKGPSTHPRAREQGAFRFTFVGRLVGLKRVDLLLDALSGLRNYPFVLEIVGDGSTRAQLERQAHALLPGRVVFRGSLRMDEAADRIAAADCLVLTSAYDGWGVTVSEAQINGTPVVCSSACGASETVRASGFGAVFEAGNMDSLRQCLAAMLDNGRIDNANRKKLCEWATCLTARAGARYLLGIIDSDDKGSSHIIPPWERMGMREEHSS